MEDRERREKADDDADSTSSVIVREDLPSVEKECDVIFHSIASNQCHFTEAWLSVLLLSSLHATVGLYRIEFKSCWIA